MKKIKKLRKKQNESKNNFIYAKEKFIKAVFWLAMSKEDIKTRLQYAYKELLFLEDEDLPIDLRSDFNLILDQISSERFIYKRGSACEKIADKILYLESRL